MKKLSKLMALLLSLLMIVSLFAACGDDKKKDKDDDKKEETTVAATKNDKEDKEDEEDIEYEEEEEDDENLTGEALLIGDWFWYIEEDGIEYFVNFYFEEDGTAECFLMETVYDDVIEKFAEMTMAEYTEEDAIAAGYASLEEMAEDIKTSLTEEMPFESLAAEINTKGTWELDGDTLTITDEEGNQMVAETELSNGVRTFTLVDADGDEIELSKD